MPFGSYEQSKEQAFASCARVLKETGCGAIKLEGGARMAETIALPGRARRAGDGPCRPDAAVDQHHRLVPRAGPRRGRLGSDRGRRQGGRRRRRLLDGDRGGGRAARRARSPSRSPIPTIGIGASPACDGQILVLEDMLGLSPRVPKFVRRYGEPGAGIEAAIEAYASDVRSRAFPGPEHVYPMRRKDR